MRGTALLAVINLKTSTSHQRKNQFALYFLAVKLMIELMLNIQSSPEKYIYNQFSVVNNECPQPVLEGQRSSIYEFRLAHQRINKSQSNALASGHLPSATEKQSTVSYVFDFDYDTFLRCGIPMTS